MKSQPDHLIIVPGHAPFKQGVTGVPDNVTNDESWVLQSFQHGEPPHYIEHIKTGVELLKEDVAGLLLFSGGRTRPEAGNWSEAATYKAIAKYCHYWLTDNAEEAQALEERIKLETFARDSFENLECSLYRFYQLLGRYPVRVTVVGWQFKAKRFKFHAQTLNIPKEHFTYVGCNNPDNVEGAMRGEERALAQFYNDPRGEHSPLSDKRDERNPFHLRNPYVNCPAVVVD